MPAVQLTSKLVEVWANPICSITDARILLTLGANPTPLYAEDYGETTLSQRRDAGSCCDTCAEKFDEFLRLAQSIYEAQFTSSHTGSVSNGSGKENTESSLAKLDLLLMSAAGKTSQLEGAGLTALSLDGGGMKGLASIVCLMFASRRIFGDESLINHIDWFVGCSTGAILALALAKGYSLTDCFFLYWVSLLFSLRNSILFLYPCRR
jgi:hypothetical protein